MFHLLRPDWLVETLIFPFGRSWPQPTQRSGNLAVCDFGSRMSVESGIAAASYRGASITA